MSAPGRTSERAGPPSHGARNLAIGAVIAFTAAAWIGDSLASYLFDRHPALLILLNARNRNLVLTQRYLDWWSFFGIGLVRLVISDPLFFVLGRWYGDAAVRWTERKSPTYGPMFRTAERWFGTASYPLVALAPNNFICLFAGASGMSVPVFAALNVGGTVGRLTLLWFVGDVFSDPLNAVQGFIAARRLPLFVLSTALLAFTIWRDRRSGQDDIEVLRGLEGEAIGDAAEPVPPRPDGAGGEPAASRAGERAGGDGAARPSRHTSSESAGPAGVAEEPA
ncbi:MAG: hypothetical protein HYX34_12600 [Actinobacteria bacterium]|nr:hypothetical protein [Actinomycetota bacterium]